MRVQIKGMDWSLLRPISGLKYERCSKIQTSYVFRIITNRIYLFLNLNKNFHFQFWKFLLNSIFTNNFNPLPVL